MTEVLFSDSRVKVVPFEENEPHIKVEYFETKVGDIPTDTADIFFGTDINDFGSGNDAYGDLFLMDPNDLLGVREEVIGSESSNFADDIPVPLNFEAIPSIQGLPRRSTRRKRPKPKQLRKTSHVSDDRDSSDFEDFFLPVTQIQNNCQISKPLQGISVQTKFENNCHLSQSSNSGNYVLLNSGFGIPSNLSPLQLGAEGTRRVISFKRDPDSFGRGAICSCMLFV